MSDREACKRVLDHLRDMIGICRDLRRQDLVRYYQEGWELVAIHVFFGGRLPPYNCPSYQGKGYYPEPEPKPTTVPRWHKEKYSKPLRRIIAHLDDYDVLECGHRLSIPYEVDPNVTRRRRRCGQCARNSEAAKAANQPASSSTTAALPRRARGGSR